ncbi:phage tail protein, partial [Streptomyces chlorus]
GTGGATAGGSEGERRLRAAVAAATYLHRVRGTRRGLSEAVRLVFGVTPQITESGAAEWHARPLGPVPGDHRPHLHVSLALPDPAPADAYRLDALVAAARPAHMPYTVKVTAATAAERTTDR